MERILLLNSPIVTEDGVYRLKTITLDEAKAVLDYSEGDIISYIGHQSTASIMSKLLEFDVPVNRGMASQNEGEIALIFKLGFRAEEGKVYSIDEVEKAGGFEIKMLTRKL